MRGEPLHLCAAGHRPFWYTGEPCPICALLAENQQLREALEAVQRQLRTLPESEQP